MTAIKQSKFEGDDRHEKMIQTIVQTAGFMSNPRQAEYWLGLANLAHPVPVVSAYDIWDADTVKMLNFAVRPAKKECYRVAACLSKITSGRARYTEGQMWASVLGVDHAFNYIVDRDVYVDFTVEFALRKDPTREAHIAFRSFDDDAIWDIIRRNGYYGNIYNEIWLKEHKQG